MLTRNPEVLLLQSFNVAIKTWKKHFCIQYLQILHRTCDYIGHSKMTYVLQRVVKVLDVVDSHHVF